MAAVRALRCFTTTANIVRSADPSSFFQLSPLLLFFSRPSPSSAVAALPHPLPGASRLVFRRRRSSLLGASLLALLLELLRFLFRFLPKGIRFARHQFLDVLKLLGTQLVEFFHSFELLLLVFFNRSVYGPCFGLGLFSKDVVDLVLGFAARFVEIELPLVFAFLCLVVGVLVFVVVRIFTGTTDTTDAVLAA